MDCLKTKTELETNSSYSFFVDSMKKDKELSLEQDAYKGSFQKCFRDSVGKILFLNVNMYNFKESVYKNRFPESSLSGLSFSFSCQMQNEMGTLNVDLFSVGEKTLKEVEDYFLKMWKNNGCFYYEKFEG